MDDIIIDEYKKDGKSYIEFKTDYKFKALKTLIPHFKKKYADTGIYPFYINQHLKNKTNKTTLKSKIGESYQEIGNIRLDETLDGEMYVIELFENGLKHLDDIRDGLESTLLLRNSPIGERQEQAYESSVGYDFSDY